MGTLDITLYRDDLAERGPQAILRGTEINFDINGRHVIEATDRTAPSGRAGGRPAGVYRFASRELTVTDPFAVLKPPG